MCEIKWLFPHSPHFGRSGLVRPLRRVLYEALSVSPLTRISPGCCPKGDASKLRAQALGFRPVSLP